MISILYLYVSYPFAIRYLSFCDPILYLSILGFQLRVESQKAFFCKQKKVVKLEKILGKTQFSEHSVYLLYRPTVLSLMSRVRR